MEIIILISLAVWFLWGFIFGGFARALDGNMKEWALLLISFLTIIFISIVACFL